MSEKDSKGKTGRLKEEEYFAREESLKRKALREKLDQQRETVKSEKAKHPHWMKCPKCGGEMVELAYYDVMVDKCKGCNGVYLDNGELELLLEGKSAKGFFSKFMEAVGGSGD
jgi:uncharacterized protein